MTTHPLIRALVRQTTILVARLATLQGARSSLAQIPDQVFLDLVRELERQGVSRKVSADMFGVGLRTHRRQIHRVIERTSEGGRSLWETILDFVARSEEPLSRKAVLTRFARDDELQVRAVLRDLCASGLVDRSGSNRDSAYRASSRGQFAALLIQTDDAPNTPLPFDEEPSATLAAHDGVQQALDCLRATLVVLRERVVEFDATQPPTTSDGA